MQDDGCCLIGHNCGSNIERIYEGRRHQYQPKSRPNMVRWCTLQKEIFRSKCKMSDICPLLVHYQNLPKGRPKKGTGCLKYFLKNNLQIRIEVSTKKPTKLLEVFPDMIHTLSFRSDPLISSSSTLPGKQTLLVPAQEERSQ